MFFENFFYLIELIFCWVFLVIVGVEVNYDEFVDGYVEVFWIEELGVNCWWVIVVSFDFDNGYVGGGSVFGYVKYNFVIDYVVVGVNFIFSVYY